MKTKIFLISILLGFIAVSCDEYLREEMVSNVGYDYFLTEQGIEDGINATYKSTKSFYGGSISYYLTESGTDEYMNGSDNARYYNFYNSDLSPFTGGLNSLWANLYTGINTSNILINNIPTVDFVNPTIKESRFGEACYLRAVFYFILVRQFGSIPLKLSATDRPEREFKRAPVSEIYKQIILDLQTAITKLPVSQTDYGRVTKGAAQHLLSLVYLTRTSADLDIRGAQAGDLDSVIFYSEAVINSGKYSLEPDYNTLWNYYIENKNDNPNCPERIWAIQNCNDPLLGANDRGVSDFLMQYDILPGMKRDIENGRPYKSLMPTEHSLFLIYDNKVDSRFYKEFKMVFYCNNPNSIPKYNDGTPKFALGDTAVFMTLHKDVKVSDVLSTYYTWMPYSIIYDDGSGYFRNGFAENQYPSLKKNADPYKQTMLANVGQRDLPIYRFAETLLIAAEAYGRKGNYTKAVEYINIVRKRAAYKDGEFKPNFLTLHGGDPSKLTSSTENDILITETDINTPDKFVNFILDERSRELLGECHRWFDLVRCDKLYERVTAYNPKAYGFREYHKLRPIPQTTHIDQLVNPGPIEEEQNIGYY